MSLRKLRLVIAALVGLIACLLVTSPAAAGTRDVAVTMKFAEPIVPAFKKGCPVAEDVFCGAGQVMPFGRATETIEFGACGPGCDFRTINLASGSILAEETFGDGTCPGSCHPNPAEPVSGTLTDVVVGGTGIFEGATGTLIGTVRASGPQSQVKLSGTITLDP
jgi:hypothetical protein